MIFKEVVSSIENFRTELGAPSKLAGNKVITSLDEHCKNFISLSPILFLATSNEKGLCDVSPKGDAPGFVHILDEKHLLIPERPGNKRIDSITNILENPQIGLIFLIPGLEETLRMNGRACVTRDQELLEKMAVNGKVPQYGIGVEIYECFIHCAKALKRSSLWINETWPEKECLPSIPKMMADHVKLSDVTQEYVKEALLESYTKRMY